MKILATYPWATLELFQWLQRIDGEEGGRLVVTGLFRPWLFNRLVGGLDDSRHLVAKGADLRKHRRRWRRTVEVAKRLAPPGGEVVVEPGHIHLEVA